MSASGLMEKAIRENLFTMEYLIYSSHKTGTQTLNRTLNLNRIPSRHCHALPHIHLGENDLKAFAELYFRQHGRKLKIISTFREPIERYISSFFQEHGSRPLRLNQVQHEEETIIHQYPVEKLQQTFYEALKHKSIICFEESLHDICRQLGRSPATLAFDPSAPFSLTELESIQLYLMRFDVLFRNPQAQLSRLTGRSLDLQNTNIASQKWYWDIYRRFKYSLAVPPGIVKEIYQYNKDLIHLFYPGTEQETLQKTLHRFSETSGSGSV